MRSTRAALAGVLACAVTLTGCTENRKDGEGAGGAAAVMEVVQDVRGEARTPAADLPNSQKGGVIGVLMGVDFEFLDPAAIYGAVELATGTQLLYRTLTGYIEDPRGGSLRLVGDLATNTGKSADGGRKWTYTLREGIRFEDGAPITSKDIAYGIARSFSEFGDPGPSYIKEWLSPDNSYKGPYNGGAPLPPGVATPDDSTIEFTFAEPHPDFPMAAALPMAAPVPQAKDTKGAYNTSFVASGPYRLKPGSYRRDQSMVLVRNEHWDPKTDPIRHQYPDEFRFRFDVTNTTQTQRLISDSGEDQTAIAIDGVPVELIAQVRNDAKVQDRVIQGESPFVGYLHINTKRVPDVDVRRALNFAFNRDAYVKARGGSLQGSPSTTIGSPTLPGYQKYDAYPAPATGDPEKSKKLLAGKNVPPLNYCFVSTPSNQRIAAGVKAGLDRGGFTINIQPKDGATMNAAVGVPSTDCDLINGGWGMDYPDGSTVFQPLFGAIRPSGNTNLSYFADPGVEATLKKLGAEPDRTKAAKGYNALDKELMEKFAPVVPTVYERYFSLIGSKVGGAHLTPLYGQTAFVNLFVE